ncbi:fimbria assembly protein [Enterobacter kobei]|uniref:fimbria assembly protein n=1 Tax=Enterobacter kobei TaxID=208224 RepID=UPI0028D5411F|nr:fimbria assembly protein [Enterobacter kobei]WNP33632.1 fimbria assembly protein [Enterobacter kobei]
MHTKFRLIFWLMMAVVSQTNADTSLGEINIELHGTIVAYSCAAQAGDSNKSVTMGTWATKQSPVAGSTTPSVPFTLALTGCPPGAASITFSGRSVAGSGLLALRDSAMAHAVAIEIMDSDRTRLPLEQASRYVDVDSNGNATLTFYAHYIALTDQVQPGAADAEATFTINYY